VFADLPLPFMKDMEVYSKRLWTWSQQELDKKYAHHKEARRADLATYELIVYSAAACIDLMLWAVHEDSGGWTVGGFKVGCP